MPLRHGQATTFSQPMSRLSFAGLLWCVAALGQAAATESIVIDPGTHHLGTPGFPEWQEFEGRTPHGRRLDLTFEARKNETPHTLFLRQWQGLLQIGYIPLLLQKNLDRMIKYYLHQFQHHWHTESRNNQPQNCLYPTRSQQ